jgi:hypothetical protein
MSPLVAQAITIPFRVKVEKVKTTTGADLGQGQFARWPRSQSNSGPIRPRCPGRRSRPLAAGAAPDARAQALFELGRILQHGREI